MVNVLWGSFNFFIAYLLLVKVEKFELKRWPHVFHVAVGGILMAIMLARAFGRFYGGL